MFAKSFLIKSTMLLTGVAMLASAGLFDMDQRLALLLTLAGIAVGFLVPFVPNPPQPRTLERDAHALASAYVCGKHNIGHVQLMEIINGQRTDVDSDKILKDYNLTYRQFQTRLNFGAQVTQ